MAVEPTPHHLATARDICQWLHADPDATALRPSTIRVWKLRGQVTVHGKRDGWNLYDVDEVLALAYARNTPCDSA